MNIERLNIIAEWLEAGAPHKNGVDGFDMTSWAGWDTDCGTACCIGGAADQWFVKGKKDSASVATGTDIEYLAEKGKSKAAKALGLSGPIAVDLFFPGRQGVYMGCITPAWAARCIRKLIETGEVDWVGTQAA